VLRPVAPAARKGWPAWLLAGALALWLLVGGVVAPLLAPRLASGGALARLLAEWRGALRDGVLVLLAFGALVPAWRALASRRVGRWIEPATPGTLGAIRAWIAMILLASVVWEDLPSSAFLPRGMLETDPHWLVGILRGLPVGFDALMASPAGLAGFEGATALLLVLAAAGLGTRWTVPAAALAYLVFASILRSYAWSYHTGVVPLYALLLLAFTPCGDGWSLDGWLRRRRGLPVAPAGEPRLRYGVARWLVWAGIAVPYGMAGLSKLRNTGFGWWDGEHMRQMLVATVVEPMHFDFQVTFLLLDAPAWAFGALAFTALLGEVTFPLVLVHRAARWALPGIMAGMHLGILLMQNILFPDLIAIQAVFYDWAPLRRRLAAGWAGVRARAGRAAAALPRLAAGGEVDPAVRRSAGTARAFLAVCFVVWATRTERFPLTAMQMFSRPLPARPVEYVLPRVRYEDGTVERARFERWIGAMADTRYRRLIRRDERPERVALLREFLDASAARANASAAPGRRVRAFELEHRRWDFRRHPHDPARGELLHVLRHEVAPSASGAAAWVPAAP
jgi:hypothetical protein